jgi:diadenosine tetraphosphate (Ap4A) HIT family hydrolase
VAAQADRRCYDRFVLRDDVYPAAIDFDVSCVFCTEFDQEGPGRIIYQDDLAVVIPALGCFAAGYCLLLPVLHTNSFGDLPERQLGELSQRVEALRSRIADRFGSPVIVAEHGAGQCEPGAACADHCHLHFIPVADPAAVGRQYHRVSRESRRLASMIDLRSAGGEPYVYLSPAPGEHYFWSAAANAFPRQFARRVCAAQMGMGDQYDWRDFPHAENMARTCEALREQPAPW